MKINLIDVGRKKPMVVSWEHSGCYQAGFSHLLQGKRPQSAKAMHLKDMAEMPRTQGGWVLLDEQPGESLLLGLVGKFWRPVIKYAPVESSAFRDFNEPLPPWSRWTTTTRSFPGRCGPRRARRPVAGSGNTGLSASHSAPTSSSNGLLEVVRDLAEKQPTRPRQAAPPWQESRGAAIGHHAVRVPKSAAIRAHPPHRIPQSTPIRA